MEGVGAPGSGVDGLRLSVGSPSRRSGRARDSGGGLAGHGRAGASGHHARHPLGYGPPRRRCGAGARAPGRGWSPICRIVPMRPREGLWRLQGRLWRPVPRRSRRRAGGRSPTGECRGGCGHPLSGASGNAAPACARGGRIPDQGPRRGAASGVAGRCPESSGRRVLSASCSSSSPRRSRRKSAEGSPSPPWALVRGD